MLKLSDASVEDVETRLKELKQDFIDLSEGRRSDVDDNALKDMIREVDSLDTFLTLSSAVQRREESRIAATAGAIAAAGFRSLGDAIITDDFKGLVGRDLSAGWTDHVTADGRRTKRQPISSFMFSNDDGKRDGTDITNFLNLASIYGPGQGQRAITEWSSSGPGAGVPFPSGYDPTTAGALLPVGQPIPPTPRRARLYLRNLIPVITTGLSNIPYVRELNPTTYESAASGGAQTVGEGSTKPSANLSFQPANAPITVVADTLTVSKQMFADAPTVIQYINNRLPYLVKFREDALILSGNGTWPNPTGILNTPGLQSQTATTGEFAITLGNAFAKVEGVDAAPTAVVLNPADAWAMFTKRAAGGSGTFDAGNPFDSPMLTVWGVPTYRTRVQPQGTALVGDFQMGATIADRQQVSIDTYNERYAEQNLVLIICEERIGVLVERPDVFVNTTLS